MKTAFCLSLPVVLVVATLALAEPASNSGTADQAKASPLKDPYFLLIRDDGIRNRLALAANRRRSIDAILHENNRLLLAIRDVGPQGVPEEVRPKLAAVRAQIDKVLDEQQRSRIEGLILQAQSYDGLLRPDMVNALELSGDQQNELRNIKETFQQRVAQLNNGNANQSQDVRQQEFEKARTERHQKVLAVLNEQQKKLWAARLGEPFDFAKLSAGTASAPEFAGIETWLNSPELSVESLRGRVVVIHFFAFNCINCIHNYPWYREWQEAYADRDVTIIGIHTPETEAETNVDALRQKLEENGLKFPVAVDGEKQMWQAWSNNIWPAVYLVDKAGNVRYWWYGELDWQGAGGQHLARKRIDELLGEKPDQK
jgi:peroxiredoxin